MGNRGSVKALVIILALLTSGCAACGTLEYDENGHLTKFKVDRNVLVEGKDGTKIDSKFESPLKNMVKIGI